MERILAQREKRGKLEYHIKWLGYDESHNSWEPQANVLDAKLLTVWKQSQASQQVRCVGLAGLLVEWRVTRCVRAAQGSSEGASSSSAKPTATAPKKAASKASRCVAHPPRPASRLH